MWRCRTIRTSLIGGADQLILGATHFALAMLVARRSGVQGVAYFSFGYALVVGASMAHGAVIGESISASRTVLAVIRRSGARVIVAPTVAATAGAALLLQPLAGLGGAARVVRGAPFLAALLLSTVFWTCRSYAYRAERPARALLASLVYGTVLLASASGLIRPTVGGLGRDAPFAAIAVGAAAGVAASLLPWTRRLAQGAWASGAAEVRALWSELTGYATWALPASGLIWLASNGFYVLMPLRGHEASAAGLRAVLTLLVPVNTVMVGAASALLPQVAAAVDRDGRTAIGRRAHRFALFAFLAGIPFGGIVWLFGGTLMSAVFGPEFAQYGELARAAAILPSLWSASLVYRTTFRASGSTVELFRVYAVAMAPAGVMAMMWASAGGPSRAITGFVVIQGLVCIGFLVRARYLFRGVNETAVDDAPSMHAPVAP